MPYQAWRVRVCLDPRSHRNASLQPCCTPTRSGRRSAERRALSVIRYGTRYAKWAGALARRHTDGPLRAALLKTTFRCEGPGARSRPPSFVLLLASSRCAFSINVSRGLGRRIHESGKDEMNVVLQGVEQHFWRGTEAGWLGCYDFAGETWAGDGSVHKCAMGAGSVCLQRPKCNLVVGGAERRRGSAL